MANVRLISFPIKSKQILIEINFLTDITEDELVSQSVMFFLAGYDTTATLIALTCYNLAIHSDIQQRLFEQIQSNLLLWSEQNPQTNDPYQLATFDNLNHFDYLNAVINETLRLYPPALFLERKASNDIDLETCDAKTQINVRKGDVIHIPVWSLHRSSTNFPEPVKYNPDRFLGTPKYHKYSFLPFGYGPRNCLGYMLAKLQAKIAVFHIIKNYQLKTCSETKVNFLKFKSKLLIFENSPLRSLWSFTI